MPQRPTSNKMKLLKGTARKDREREPLEFPPAETHQPPDWLVGPEAVTEWNEKVALLAAAGTLTKAGLSTLGHYCNLHAAAVRQWRAGLSPTAADLTQLRLFATEFQFTPASQLKGGPKKQPAANPFRELTGS